MLGKRLVTQLKGGKGNVRNYQKQFLSALMNVPFQLRAINLEQPDSLIDLPLLASNLDNYSIKTKHFLNHLYLSRFQSRPGTGFKLHD